MQLTPVFLPGKSHGQRSMVSYSPWGGKEWGTAGQLPLFTFRRVIIIMQWCFCSSYGLPGIVLVLLMYFISSRNVLLCFNSQQSWCLIEPGPVWGVSQILAHLNLTLQWGNWDVGSLKQFSQGSQYQWQSWDLNPGSLYSESFYSITSLF